MVSRFITKIAGLAFVSSLVPLQGCMATRNWVGEQVSPVNDRVGKLETQVGQMDKRLTTAEGRITVATSKADDADTKANQAITKISDLRLEPRLDVKLDDGVLFRFGSATLTNEGKQSIDAFLSDVHSDGKGPQIFVVGGHTDNVGTGQYNYELGRKRAEAVTEYLILDKKIDPMRVVTASFGESSPFTSNDTPEGRDKNRRVEIRVYSEVIASGSGTPVAQR